MSICQLEYSTRETPLVATPASIDNPPLVIHFVYDHHYSVAEFTAKYPSARLAGSGELRGYRFHINALGRANIRKAFCANGSDLLRNPLDIAAGTGKLSSYPNDTRVYGYLFHVGHEDDAKIEKEHSFERIRCYQVIEARLSYSKLPKTKIKAVFYVDPRNTTDGLLNIKETDEQEYTRWTRGLTSLIKLKCPRWYITTVLAHLHGVCKDVEPIYGSLKDIEYHPPSPRYFIQPKEKRKATDEMHREAEQQAVIRREEMRVAREQPQMADTRDQLKLSRATLQASRHDHTRVVSSRQPAQSLERQLVAEKARVAGVKKRQRSEEAVIEQPSTKKQRVDSLGHTSDPRLKEATMVRSSIKKQRIDGFAQTSHPRPQEGTTTQPSIKKQRVNGTTHTSNPQRKPRLSGPNKPLLNRMTSQPVKKHMTFEHVRRPNGQPKITVHPQQAMRMSTSPPDMKSRQSNAQSNPNVHLPPASDDSRPVNLSYRQHNDQRNPIAPPQPKMSEMRFKKANSQRPNTQPQQQQPRNLPLQAHWPISRNLNAPIVPSTTSYPIPHSETRTHPSPYAQPVSSTPQHRRGGPAAHPNTYQQTFQRTPQSAGPLPQTNKANIQGPGHQFAQHHGQGAQTYTHSLPPKPQSAPQQPSPRLQHNMEGGHLAGHQFISQHSRGDQTHKPSLPQNLQSTSHQPITSPYHIQGNGTLAPAHQPASYQAQGHPALPQLNPQTSSRTPYQPGPFFSHNKGYGTLPSSHQPARPSALRAVETVRSSSAELGID